MYRVIRISCLLRAILAELRMTFKKAEMAKTLKNGLSMIETNPLNHNWSDFVILLG